MKKVLKKLWKFVAKDKKTKEKPNLSKKYKKYYGFKLFQVFNSVNIEIKLIKNL